jgi:tetratricopeptide (TPR) repeat protein
LRQVERSEALNEFHQFLLSDAAPSGKPFTVNELLGHAEQIVERQHTASDPNRVRLMISIGRQYLEQDVGTSARRILEEAYKLSRGLGDASIRAQASCTLAAELARDQELQVAEALYQEGLRELPQDTGFALDRIDCLQSGIEIAGETGDIQEGIARALAAQHVLRDSPFDSEVLEMHRWTDLAKAYGSAGRDREAVAAYEHAGALLSTLGRDHTGTAVTLFNNWALELDQLGRPRDAERMYRRAIEISSTDQAEDGVSPVILCNYSKVLRELGQLADAERYAERAYNKAQQVGLPVAINHAMLSMARIYTAQGRPARAAIMYAQVEPRLRKNLPPGHFAFATLSAARALNALAAGDTFSALKLADEAVSIDEAAIQSGAEGGYFLPSLLITRAQVELASARVDQAAEDAARALDLSRSAASPGSFSSIQGAAFLVLGRARQAQGRREEARAALRSALAHLQDAVGPEQPETRTAQHLLAALESHT